ncbi:MAG: flagellar hook-basal body protein [Ruminococcus sp.]|nr:flagellar hook-basal body protein [Ruminococcus sp.]MCM1479011.1 flagellar hook-basal body protein [Muribaculaceae bacterium]
MGKIGYYSAASAVIHFQMAMDITGNNLANVNTNGFKASRPSFADLIYTERNNDNEETQFGHGMRVQKTDMMFEQSQIRSTGRKMDWAALDEGFFACATPEGITTYTKDGAFYMTETQEGVWELCNEEGAYVLDYEGNRITIPFLDEESQEIDFSTLTEQIGVYRFDNPYGLDQIGDNYFIETASSGAAIVDPLATKKEGYLEASSTSVANEMSKVIEYQRAYQLNINMVKTHDELQGIVNNLRN